MWCVILTSISRWSQDDETRLDLHEDSKIILRRQRKHTLVHHKLIQVVYDESVSYLILD